MNTTPVFADSVQIAICLLLFSLCFTRLSQIAYHKWRAQGLHKYEERCRALVALAAASYRLGVAFCLTPALLWAVRQL